MKFLSFGRSLCAAALAAFVFSIDPGPLAAPAGKPIDPNPLANMPPMRVVIVRDGDPNCEPNCAEWISSEGALHPESANEFRKALNAMGKRKLPVLINSPGGSVEAALAIGRMIHARQLDVAVSKTEFKPCDGQPSDCRSGRKIVWRGEPHSRGAICASACPFILAAGAHRFVAPWSGVGVHQVTEMMRLIKRTLFIRTLRLMTPNHEIITQKSIEGEKDSSRIVKLDAPTLATVAKIRSYLAEMGISEELQKLAAATPPQSIHLMSHMELDATHLATDYYGGEQLIAQSYLAQMPNQKDATLSASQAEHRDSDPKPDVTSLSYSVLQSPGFADHDVPVILELLHRKGEPTVEMNAVVDERAGFIPTANLMLVLQFGVWTEAPTFDAASALPTAPLSGVVPISSICNAQKANSLIKVTLMQLTPGAKISGPPAFFDIRSFKFMPDLVADICNSGTNAAAQKLDRPSH
jgi:hypothetical protein